MSTVNIILCFTLFMMAIISMSHGIPLKEDSKNENDVISTWHKRVGRPVGRRYCGRNIIAALSMICDSDFFFYQSIIKLYFS